MPPTSSPPSFYQNVAAMSPAAPKAGGGAPGGAKGVAPGQPSAASK